jgi:hypothetical protein
MPVTSPDKSRVGTKEIEMDNNTIFISSNPQVLAELQPVITIEAEYGDVVVEGSQLTLAHHGPRSANPCPCVANVMPIHGLIGVSHFDLDTLGGVMRVDGYTPTNEFERRFWEVAAWVDTHGPHQVESQVSTEPAILAALQAFWAWSQKNRLFPPREGGAVDCTEFFRQAADALQRIFKGDTAMLMAGAAMVAQEAKLEADSYRSLRLCNGVLVVIRESNQFVNHLYKEKSGLVCDMVVAYNSKFKSITVSKRDDSVQVNCRDLVQLTWGPEAGGHAGIAGSPRNRKMNESDIEDIFSALYNMIS